MSTSGSAPESNRCSDDTLLTFSKEQKSHVVEMWFQYWSYSRLLIRLHARLKSLISFSSKQAKQTGFFNQWNDTHTVRFRWLVGMVFTPEMNRKQPQTKTLRVRPAGLNKAGVKEPVNNTFFKLKCAWYLICFGWGKSESPSDDWVLPEFSNQCVFAKNKPGRVVRQTWSTKSGFQRSEVTLLSDTDWNSGQKYNN